MQITKPKDVNVKTVYIRSNGHKIPILIVSPANQRPDAPGILWIHGGCTSGRGLKWDTI